MRIRCIVVRYLCIELTSDALPNTCCRQHEYIARCLLASRVYNYWVEGNDVFVHGLHIAACLR